MEQIWYIILIILLIILFLTLYYSAIEKNILNTFDTNPPKYAVCMWGELRGIKSTVESFYSHLVKPLNADLFVCCQKTNTNIDDNINLFNEKVVEKTLYDKPDSNKVYTNLDKLVDRHNYRRESNLQMYYNFNKINELYGDLFEKNYDYIILTRSDFLYLFDFPDIMNLSNDSNIIWNYEGHSWGGINMCLLCVPSKFIKQYLVLSYNYLNDSNNINFLNSMELNNEVLYQILFDNYGWVVGNIENNAFISADSNNEITSWQKISYNEIYKVYYKYEEQLNKSYDSYEKWKNGGKWVKKDNTIVVE